MRLRLSLLILAGWMASPAAHAAAPPPAANAPGKCDCEAAQAPIEEVLNVVDDGYGFDAYIVRWHGARVLVTAPLADGHLKAGDDLTFMAMKLKLSGQQQLTFISMDRSGSAQAFEALGRTLYHEDRQPALTAGGESTAVPIQEVLQAEDGGYQQTAYIGQWHGARVAMTCLLTCGPYNVGDRLPVIVGRLAAGGIKSLSFQVMPKAEELSAAATAVPQMDAQTTQETGIIEQVISSQLDGAPYAAYIVQWKGASIAVPVTSPPASHHVGESLLLQAVRMKMPPPIGGGLITFSTDGLASAAELSAAMTMSMSTGNGVVESVLSAQDEIYNYRAYVVNLHGARVIVQDMLGSTHYLAGDPITFSEVKSGGSGASFMVLDFVGLMKKTKGQSEAH